MSTTTFLVKIDKDLKSRAASLADELGISLSGVINAYMKQFVRDGTFSVSREIVNSTKVSEWICISDKMDHGLEIGANSKNADELFEHLHI